MCCKERAKAVRHLMPFTSIPSKVLTHMVFFVVKLLNLFPVEGGVLTDEYSPKTILSGQTINYKQYLLPFNTTAWLPEPKEQYWSVPHPIARAANYFSPLTQAASSHNGPGLSSQCHNQSLPESTTLKQISQAY